MPPDHSRLRPLLQGRSGSRPGKLSRAHDGTGAPPLGRSDSSPAARGGPGGTFHRALGGGGARFFARIRRAHSGPPRLPLQPIAGAAGIHGGASLALRRASVGEPSRMRFFRRMSADEKRARRLRQIVVRQLTGSKWALVWAGFCTLGLTLTELARPWPLKVIF